MKPLEVWTCQRAENLKKKSSKIPKNNYAAKMVSAARRQIIGGGGGGGAPINKSRRRRRPQIVGGGAARPAHGSKQDPAVSLRSLNFGGDSQHCCPPSQNVGGGQSLPVPPMIYATACKCHELSIIGMCQAWFNYMYNGKRRTVSTSTCKC